MVSQGLDSKIKGTRVVTFSTPRGIFKACSTPTLNGYKMLFYCDKEAEGVTFMNWLVNFSIHPLIL